MQVVVYAGQGDARRSMALLWRDHEPAERTGPGPKSQLSVDLVVETAIEVADAEGLQALSMRAVGERLGRTAMSLYTYVASKNELVDLMYDHAFGELVREREAAAPTLEGTTDRRAWREEVLAWAGGLWRFYLRHPWSLEISQARPVLGPNEYTVTESLVTVLHRAGLPAKAISSAHASALNLVRGLVRTAAEARQAQTVTGVPEDEWWYARSAQLEEVSDDFSERFPTLALMTESGAFDNADPNEPYLEQESWESFQFGLDALLDGVERQIDVSSAAREAT
jgi:AcrR family transcriptional regulator